MQTGRPMGRKLALRELDSNLVTESLKIINELEAVGGMAKAIEDGMPKGEFFKKLPGDILN